MNQQKNKVISQSEQQIVKLNFEAKFFRKLSEVFREHLATALSNRKSMLNQLQRVEELGEANLKKDVIKHYSCLANKIFKDKLAQAQQLEAKIEEKREITPNLRKR